MAVKLVGTNYYSVNVSAFTNTNHSFCGWFKINTDRNDESTPFSVIDNVGFLAHIIQTRGDGTTLQWYDLELGGMEIAPCTVGEWYWCGVSVAGTTGTIRFRGLNDAAFVTLDSIGTTATQVGTFTIGNDVFDETFNGSLAYVKLWNTALTATQLEAEYASPTPVTPATAYYRFDTASTTDNSGNGNTLGVGGSPSPTNDTSPALSAGPTTKINGWGPIPIR